MYYKFFKEDGRTTFGRAPWPVGEWLPPIKGDLIPCVRGYHVCRPSDLVYWIGPKVARVEVKGKIVEENGYEPKVVVGQARNLGFVDNWNKLTIAHFALDCAEHILPTGYPKTKLMKARLFLQGCEPYNREMIAYDSHNVILDSDLGPDTAYAVADALFAASCTKMYDTANFAHATANAAARASIASIDIKAEREWQNNRLLEYIGDKNGN